DQWADAAHDVSSLRPPWWLPYRHGLDFVSDLASAVAGSAQDLADRRRAAKEYELAEQIGSSPGLARVQVVPAVRRRDEDDEEEGMYADSGWVVRFLTNPVALLLTLFVLAALVAARPAFGEIQGGALSPVPRGVGDWWRLHVESQHP